MEKIKNMLIRGTVGILFAFLITQCGNDGETRHYTYIANVEWSPSPSNTLVISKDEYDETVGKTSGCGNEVYDLNPRGPAYQLFLTDTSGAVRKQLSVTMNFSIPFRIRWSPEGDRFILYGNSIPTLYSIDTTGATIAADSLGYTSDADWSPDGQTILCSSVKVTNLYPRLYTVNALTGIKTQLLPDSIHTGAVAWSSQNRIAFAFARGGTSTLATMNPDGSNFMMHDSGGYFNAVRWSPDGTLLLYSKTSAASSEVTTLIIASMVTVRLLEYTDGTQISSLRYSPDGMMISYYLYNSPDKFYLSVMSTNGSNQQSIATQSTDGSWSPDSKSIAYVYYNAVYTTKVR